MMAKLKKIAFGLKVFKKSKKYLNLSVLIILYKRRDEMTIKEKLQFFSDNGMSVSFIARKINGFIIF